MNDLVGVADNCQTGVVRDYDDLPTPTGVSNAGDKLFRHRRVVQIGFRLVDDQWHIEIADEEIENQRQRSPFTWGKAVPCDFRQI